jgi:hypothetical protein
MRAASNAGGLLGLDYDDDDDDDDGAPSVSGLHESSESAVDMPSNVFDVFYNVRHACAASAQYSSMVLPVPDAGFAPRRPSRTGTGGAGSGGDAACCRVC